MAMSGLDIYKLLPKTNCKECGFATCLAFAMQLAKKAVSIEKCPYLSPEAKKTLEASAQPPIKLVTLGSGDRKLEIGNESVMFRHEEKFHHPCGIGFILEDTLTDPQIKDSVSKINQLNFERVGQKLEVNIIAIRQNSTVERFIKSVETILNNTQLSIALVSDDPKALKGALELAKDRKPLIYKADATNFSEVSKLAVEYKCPLVISAKDLNGLAELVKNANALGISDIILSTENKNISGKVWDLTQARRLALKKSNRSYGYPTIAVVEEADPYDQIIEASTYISKYAGIVLIKGFSPWQALALLTLRQNIYTDPQKPLQIEPKLYSIGHVSDKSPILITTNFSLSYFTVLGEVEASKIPAYIASVDTEGMSVLTAWAAEKFNAEKINIAMQKFAVKDVVSHRKLVIPGYLAVMSGDLQEQSGWEVIVGPKEAAGIPSFLKNL